MLIQEKEKLTDTEKRILDYIRQNQQDIEGMSVRKLAIVTHTSNASIMRLCEKLGYSGFAEMKKEILRANEADKFLTHQIDFKTPFQNDKTAVDVMKSVGSLIHASTDALLMNVRPQDIQTFAEYLFHAKRIYIFASGESMICCRGFAANLSKLSIYPIFAMDSDVPLMSADASFDDCALFASYSGNAKYMNNIRALKEKHCRVLLITARRNAEIAVASDNVLILPDHEDKKNVYLTFYSQIAFTYVLNCIYTMMRFKKQGKES